MTKLPVKLLDPSKAYWPIFVNPFGKSKPPVAFELFLNAYSGILVTFEPIVRVTIGVAPPSFVPLLNTEYCESEFIVAQFVALKCTMARLGQFQKADPPMVSTP